jgi:hypothetical protein
LKNIGGEIWKKFEGEILEGIFWGGILGGEIWREIIIFFFFGGGGI